MKKLKLEHHLAELVRAGQKTSTWRMYDDKDVHVNDEVELIDKVDPQDSSTWTQVGVAQIDVVVEKRLGEITDRDAEGHEKFASQEEMLKTYQGYYGPQVTLETPVKIIHFSLKKQGGMTSNVVEKSSEFKELKLYADGGSRGNPGPSASGFVLVGANDAVIVEKGVYLGITTNNQAEYQALKLGLEEALRLGAHNVHVYMDSLLVINQMLGIFKVKNRDLWPIHDAIQNLKPRFQHLSFTHVPRELNKLADAAVNEALDKAEKTQTAKI